jgi:hypothetical protein
LIANPRAAKLSSQFIYSLPLAAKLYEFIPVSGRAGSVKQVQYEELESQISLNGPV